MVITNITTSIVLRVAEFLFAVAVLGLSAGVLASYNTNIPRVTFNLVVAIFDIIWLAYIAFIAPKTLAGQTPTAVVFACQIILWIFYLAGWTVIVDEFPKDCNESFYMRDSKDTCHAYQAILPFSILNYIVLSTELGLFYGYSLVPEIEILEVNIYCKIPLIIGDFYSMLKQQQLHNVVLVLVLVMLLIKMMVLLLLVLMKKQLLVIQ